VQMCLKGTLELSRWHLPMSACICSSVHYVIQLEVPGVNQFTDINCQYDFLRCVSQCEFCGNHGLSANLMLWG
jgi:hypothetical protein